MQTTKISAEMDRTLAAQIAAASTSHHRLLRSRRKPNLDRHTQSQNAHQRSREQRMWGCKPASAPRTPPYPRTPPTRCKTPHYAHCKSPDTCGTHSIGRLADQLAGWVANLGNAGRPGGLSGARSGAAQTPQASANPGATTPVSWGLRARACPGKPAGTTVRRSLLGGSCGGGRWKTADLKCARCCLFRPTSPAPRRSGASWAVKRSAAPPAS